MHLIYLPALEFHQNQNFRPIHQTGPIAVCRGPSEPSIILLWKSETLHLPFLQKYEGASLYYGLNQIIFHHIGLLIRLPFINTILTYTVWTRDFRFLLTFPPSQPLTFFSLFSDINRLSSALCLPRRRVSAKLDVLGHS